MLQKQASETLALPSHAGSQLQPGTSMGSGRGGSAPVTTRHMGPVSPPLLHGDIRTGFDDIRQAEGEIGASAEPEARREFRWLRRLASSGKVNIALCRCPAWVWGASEGQEGTSRLGCYVA
jgi:hypothetical protein